MYGLLYQVLKTNQLSQLGGSRSLLPSSYGQADLFTLAIAVLIYLAIVTLFGKWIWNNVLTRVVTIVKPLESWYELWLIVMLVHLLFPNTVSIQA
jgi:Kef-type K+ transport system membrane component KefB